MGLQKKSMFFLNYHWRLFYSMWVPLISDGGEVEEKKEQNIAYKNWFSTAHEGDIQQVSYPCTL